MNGVDLAVMIAESMGRDIGAAGSSIGLLKPQPSEEVSGSDDMYALHINHVPILVHHISVRWRSLGM